MDKGEIDQAATAAPAPARAHFRMDRTERFYKIDHLIRERGVVPVGDFLRELEVSLATFKRDIEYMRSRHHAPIEWDREAQALLTMQHLLESLEPTLLGAQSDLE
jgi:predicted DNA-binding transcriptional regulator YafY